MGLKDMMKDATQSAVQAAQSTAQKAASQTASGIINAVAGNYAEMPADSLVQAYGMYLMDGEIMQRGFSLVRDSLIFTNMRILFIDHQGMTGKKTLVESIDMSDIFAVQLETGGIGFDSCDLTFSYIVSPYHKSNHIETKAHTISFPNGFNVQPIYCMLQTLAHNNKKRLNS